MNVIEAILDLLKRFFGGTDAEPQTSASPPTVIDTIFRTEQSIDYVLSLLDEHGVDVSEALEDLRTTITKLSDLESKGFEKTVLLAIISHSMFFAVAWLKESIDAVEKQKEAGSPFGKPASVQPAPYIEASGSVSLDDSGHSTSSSTGSTANDTKVAE